MVRLIYFYLVMNSCNIFLIKKRTSPIKSICHIYILVFRNVQ